MEWIDTSCFEGPSAEKTVAAATNAAAAAQVVSGGRAHSLGEPLAPAGDALVGTVTHRFDPN